MIINSLIYSITSAIGSGLEKYVLDTHNISVYEYTYKYNIITTILFILTVFIFLFIYDNYNLNLSSMKNNLKNLAMNNKKSLKDNNKIIVIISLVGVLMIISYFYKHNGLKSSNISLFILLSQILNIILSILIGVLYFKEVLTFTQIIGIVLGIISIILITYKF